VYKKFVYRIIEEFYREALPSLPLHCKYLSFIIKTDNLGRTDLHMNTEKTKLVLFETRIAVFSSVFGISA
jgi:hypothetical protein